jgi:DUF1365 family protein
VVGEAAAHRDAAGYAGGGMRSGIYTGLVQHERLRPKRHKLTYRVFALLVDLDEQRSLNLPLFMSFRESDHADGKTPLRPWVTGLLRDAAIDFDGGRIEVLCYPRLFGFVFNPLSVYFCYRRDGTLTGILYEVHNTHGERHTYVMPAMGDGRIVRHAAPKEFFVSPFMPMDCVYRWRITPPGPRVGISILEDDREGLLLTASFIGRREEMTQRALWSLLWRYPLMTLKVVAGIHWEALRLLVKGVRFFDHHPAADRIASSAPMSSAEKVDEPIG